MKHRASVTTGIPHVRNCRWQTQRFVIKLVSVQAKPGSLCVSLVSPDGAYLYMEGWPGPTKPNSEVGVFLNAKGYAFYELTPNSSGRVGHVFDSYATLAANKWTGNCCIFARMTTIAQNQTCNDFSDTSTFGPSDWENSEIGSYPSGEEPFATSGYQDFPLNNGGGLNQVIQVTWYNAQAESDTIVLDQPQEASLGRRH